MRIGELVKVTVEVDDISELEMIKELKLGINRVDDRGRLAGR